MWQDDLDPGIAPFVKVLDAAGIETFESCEATEGHSYAEPGIRFYGDRTEGFRAFAIARQHGFPVSGIRRYWNIIDGEPVGPHWEIIFYRVATQKEWEGAEAQVEHIRQMQKNVASRS